MFRLRNGTIARKKGRPRRPVDRVEEDKGCYRYNDARVSCCQPIFISFPHSVFSAVGNSIKCLKTHDTYHIAFFHDSVLCQCETKTGSESKHKPSTHARDSKISNIAEIFVKYIKHYFSRTKCRVVSRQSSRDPRR